MTNITKDKIISGITTHFNVWDISDEFAKNALRELSFNECRIYSFAHYKCIYTLLQAKTNTLNDKVDKIAYIDCLMMNYNSLQSNDEIDLLISLLSGSFIGISFLDITNDVFFKSFALFFLLIFVVIKTFTLTNRKWKFYLLILEQLKTDIE